MIFCYVSINNFENSNAFLLAVSISKLTFSSVAFECLLYFQLDSFTSSTFLVGAVLVRFLIWR